jgi:hypothetical protein
MKLNRFAGKFESFRLKMSHTLGSKAKFPLSVKRQAH